MTMSYERQVKKQVARKGASRTGFTPLARLLCCMPCQ